MSSRALTSAISSMRKYRPFRASRTHGRSSPSRHFERRVARALCVQVESPALFNSLFWSMILSEKSATFRDHARSRHLAHAIESWLALAPDHEQARADHDGGAGIDILARDLPEQRIAEQECP